MTALLIVVHAPAVWHSATPRAVRRWVRVALETRRALVAETYILYQTALAIGWEREGCLLSNQRSVWVGDETPIIVQGCDIVLRG
jgi:hypothetical protein